MSHDASMRLVRHCLALRDGTAACLPILSDEEVAWLNDQKLLPTYLAMQVRDAADPTPLAVALAKRDAQRVLAERAAQACQGPCQVIKGDRFAAWYPPGLLRESRDLDLVIRDEADFVRLCAGFDADGFDTYFLWLVGTPRGMAASAKYRRDLLVPGCETDSVYVELHLKSFPVTPFSTLFAFDELAGLQGAANDLVLLMAEFIYRDGKWKRFTGRDVLDAALMLDEVPHTDWPALRDMLIHATLVPGALLLADHWRAQVPWSMPPLLAWLADTLADQRWEGEYDFVEHQAWPACRQRGMDRATFDAIRRTSDALYDEHAQPSTISEAELGYWLGVGMPVAGRLVQPGQPRVLDAFELLSRLQTKPW